MNTTNARATDGKKSTFPKIEINFFKIEILNENTNKKAIITILKIVIIKITITTLINNNEYNNKK